MIARYRYLPIHKLWSEKHKFNTYLKIELASLNSWFKLGKISSFELEKLNRASFELKDVQTLEEETKHDVIAFTRAVSKSLGEEKKWFHFGLTSTDIVDTANGLRLKEANTYIARLIQNLLTSLKEKAYLYQDTPIMGRTHGMHAEITSFGLKFSLWYQDLIRLNESFIYVRSLVEVGKLSGAVGNYSASTPELERLTLQDLGLNIAPISTQTLQRDRHAHYLAVLSLIASHLDKMAIEIRHLSRTEVGEVSEYFAENQKGSSAMPHKKNPIGSENISGLSRIMRGYMIAAFENIALWHERDISHSSVERIILPDATELIAYMLKRMNTIIQTLQCYPKRMLENMQHSLGNIHTQCVLNHLIEHQYSREAAYDLVQRISQQSFQTGVSFELLLNQEPSLSTLDFKSCFEISYYLRYVKDIYHAIFEK